MTNEELIKKLRDLHRDPRPASAEWLFENQVALYDAAAAIEELQAEVKDAFDEGYNVGYTAGIGYCSFKRAKQPPQEVQDADK